LQQNQLIIIKIKYCQSKKNAKLCRKLIKYFKKEKMTHKGQEKSKTADRLEDYFVKNTLILDPFLGIQKDRVDLKAQNDIVKANTPMQLTDNTGITKQKETEKDILIKILLANTAPACSCFDSLGDTANFNKINFKEYILKRAVPSVLNGYVDIAVKVLTENLVALGDYGITALSIAKIPVAQKEYNSVSNVPEELITESSENTKKIQLALQKITRIIRVRLKNSMRILELTQPDLYALFLSITHDIIIGAHSHHAPTVITGNVIFDVSDSITGEKAVGASIKAVGIDGVSLTDETGMDEIELPVGTHIIKIIFFDHQPKEITVIVTIEDQTISVQLTPITI